MNNMLKSVYKDRYVRALATVDVSWTGQATDGLEGDGSKTYLSPYPLQFEFLKHILVLLKK